MTRVKGGLARSRASVCTGLALWALVGLWACDKNDAIELGDGEPVRFEVEGVRGIIERHAAAGQDRLMVAGRAGRDLHGRLIWSGSDGSVLADVELAGLDRPQQVTACIDGHDADVYWIAGDETESRLFVTPIRQDQVEGGGATPDPLATSATGWTMGAVVGLEEGCGVCLADRAAGELRCQLGLLPAEPRTWRTGPLGEWTVLRLGESLVLADWAADDEGWITVRIADLDAGDPADNGWFHSYVIAQLPNIADPAERPLAHPSFLPFGEDLKVVFVDGTDWFTRLFVQRFSMSASMPGEPLLVESCRGTCKIHWASVFDGYAWIWFEDQVGDWAVRIAPDGERSRASFTPPPNVQPLDRGWFKMGLGNEIANWWALLAFDPVADEE